ncbi:MAG: GGDEF domain-containing response regulator [Elusimicrobiota bacterium]
MTAKILLADDDPALLNGTAAILEGEGYVVSKAGSGAEALARLRRDQFDLVISDVVMPDLTGLDLIKKMGEDPLLRHIPAILVSAKRVEFEDRLQGLGAGSDDYIVKPCAPEEICARVKAVLHRARIGLDANPLTRLPGNSSILLHIERLLAAQTPFAILYADLNNFKSFNDRYGFLRGDDVIRFTAQVLRESAAAEPSRDFIGHVGGDDFVIITVPERAAPLCETILREFDRGIVRFYDAEDLSRRGLAVTDRRGQQVFHPIVSVAIGVVTNAQRQIQSLGEVSQIGAEMKKFAKNQTGSRFAVDRRRLSRRRGDRPGLN